MKGKTYRTRIAPTVSGLLHIGHARTFLAACDRAREFGGKVVLRIDDIDSQRCSRAYEDAAIEDIRSAGVRWDEGPDVGGEYGPYRQSERIPMYESAMERLIRGGFVYPSPQSRSEIKKLARSCARTFPFCDAEPIFPEALRPLSTTTVEELKISEILIGVSASPTAKKYAFATRSRGIWSLCAGRILAIFSSGAKARNRRMNWRRRSMIGLWI